MTAKPSYEELEKRVDELENQLSGKPNKFHLPENIISDLADIVDMQAIQSLMNHFYKLTKIGIAILDLKGNILVATGWQDICTQFHRVHPETCKNCLESDLVLSKGIEPGTFKLYRCKNHMWDMATPIMAGTVKVGNLFLGQFLFKDELPDIKIFHKHARRYGFDENKYLSALERVPRWTRETVNEVMAFYTKLANLISDLGYKNLLLNKSEERFRTIFESTTDCVFLKDSELCYSMVNPAMAKLFDKTPEELTGRTDKEIFGEKAAEHLIKTDTRVLKGETIDEEDTKPVRGIPTTFHVKKMPVWGSDGSITGLCGIARDITRQKKTEKTLQASRQNLEKIIEHLPVGIGILDDKGNILRINKQFKKMFGYTENDISTIENWAEKAYPNKNYRKKVLKVWDQYVRKVFETGLNTPPVDVEITCKDKTTRNILIFLQPGDNQHLTTFVDITERKRAEDALESQNTLLSMIMETSPVGIATVDVEGSITYANYQAEQILGIEKNKITARKYDSPEWKHTDINDEPFQDEKQPFYIVKTTGKPAYNIQHGITWPDGRSVILSINASPMRDKEGQFAGMVATFEDITEQKQTEKELKLAHERTLTILDSIDATVYVADMDTYKILFMNKRMITDFGGDKTGDICYSAFRKISKPCDYCTNDQLLDKHGSPSGVRVWHDKNPATGKYYINYDRAIEWADGRLVRLQIATDITELKKMETQLRQAQKMESVGRLAGGVAHDFNNMLGLILGHVEFALENAEENPDLHTHLKEIQTAARRSADITKQLLAFARKEIISPKQLDLNDTVEKMLNMLRRLIGEDIDLVWQPATHLWPVKMDPSQIDQILANLCINARDAISGVGKLTIETAKKSFDEEYCDEHYGFIPGDFVLLAVSDNGCGMDKDTLDNLFEPFFTTKKTGKGTGLGLATVYGIVKQNNGFINVYSEPGQGSTFKIYLPRLAADEDTDKTVPGKKAAAGGTETILLVEDEPSILRMTRMMLERKGYFVLSAATPAEAIETAGHHTDKIHLLITDVVMPEMNGRDLAGKIIELHPDIRLLFMSGYTANVIAHHGILDDGVSFIQKPFSIADLTEKVRNVLNTAPDKL